VQRYEFEQLVFDAADGRLARADGTRAVRLRPQVGTLLRYLLDHRGEVVDRETLYREIWGEDTVVDFESGLAALLRELRHALRELGADPGLIETVPRRGYRMRIRETGPGREVPGRRRTRAWRATALGLLLALGAALAAHLLWRGETTSPGVAGAHQLAILPLERFGEHDVAPERAGILLADNVLAALWRANLPGLEFIGRAGMRPYAERADVVEAVAAGLGVDLLFEGSIRTRADGWQVTLRLLAVPPGRVVWSRTLSGAEEALPVGRIARTLVEAFASDWPRVRTALDESRTAEARG